MDFAVVIANGDGASICLNFQTDSKKNIILMQMSL